MRIARITFLLTLANLLSSGLCHAQQPVGQSELADRGRIRAILLSPGTTATAENHLWEQSNSVAGAHIVPHRIEAAWSRESGPSSYALLGAIIGGVPLGLLAYSFTRGVCDGGCAGEALRWGVGAAAVGATLGAMIGSGIERR